MIVPLWVALPALAGAAASGWAIDRALRWDLDRAGALAWAIRIAVGLALVLAAFVHPLVALALAGVLMLERRSWLGAETRGAIEPGRSALVVLVVALVIVSLRPPVPLYWDEHVWLAKVRLGALELRADALDPTADVIPRGYPIVGSLAEIALAAEREDVAAMVAGAAALLLVALALALATMRDALRGPWGLVMLVVPLVWVHARSAYLDLPVGLFALAIVGGLARRERWALRAAMLAAFLVAGCKDEGVVHVLAISAAHVVASPDRRALAARESALVLAAALAATLGWHALLVAHGVPNEDHAIEAAGLARAGALSLEIARAACDVRSWGLLWPIAMGAAIATLRVGRSLSTDTARSAEPGMGREAASALLAQLAALALALLIGGDRLVAFALGGTVANRMWMQLVPVGALVVAQVLHSGVGASRISNTADGCHCG